MTRRSQGRRYGTRIKSFLPIPTWFFSLMRNRRIAPGLCLLLWSLSTSGQVTAQEVTPTGTAIANFDIGNHRFNVFPVLGNATSPVEQWQFRYEPLLLPEVDNEGQLALITKQSGQSWTVTLRLHIGDPEANQLAHQSLIEAYPNMAGKIQGSNVSQLRLDEIGFQFEPPIPQNDGELATKPFSPGSAPVVAVVFISRSQEAAEKLKTLLQSPFIILKCNYKYNTRDTKRGGAQITMRDLRGTHLEAALNGMPNKDAGIVYVRRSDLRRLTENIHREININEIFEDPILVDNDILKNILNRWNQEVTIDIQNLNQQKLKATYNAQDLSPDRIAHQVNDWFHKVQGKDEFHTNKHVLAEAGLDLGPFGGSAKADISLKEHQVKEFLEQNGYHCDFVGEKIVPKSIDLQQVNTADFAAEFQVVQTKVYVGNDLAKSQTVGVQLNQVVADKAALPEIAGRLARFQSVTMKKFKELETRSQIANAAIRAHIIDNGKRIDSIMSIQGDYLRVETLDFSADGKGQSRDPRYERIERKVELDPVKWKVVNTFGTVLRPGFFKGVSADGGRYGAWTAGGTTIQECSAIPKDGHYLLVLRVGWSGHGDNGEYNTKVQLIAIFVRKEQ